MSHKGKGGSYRRGKDGNVELVACTGWTPKKSKPEPKTSKVKGKTKPTGKGK